MLLVTIPFNALLPIHAPFSTSMLTLLSANYSKKVPLKTLT